MIETENKKLDIKIEYWKNKLLDLGKRNRFINCPISKSVKRVSRSQLIIKTPSIDDLWNTFYDLEGSIEFPIPKNQPDEYVEELFEDKQPENDEECFFFSNGYKTNQKCKDAFKTLLSIKKKAYEFRENKGLNCLYLSFGFINWKEEGNKGKNMRSPLLLVPVSLSQNSIADPIVLSRIDDEIICNDALIQKMRIAFGIEFPEYIDGVSYNDYFRKVSKVCKSMDWFVDQSDVQLSLFSYLKMAMYKDIENNKELIKNNEIINYVTNNKNSISNYTDVTQNEKTNIIDNYNILDADSSQQEAIEFAKDGNSFVLQGPPGTGKSQTITNIIASLISQGKKVLFVSEKAAALQVVYDRLEKSGLSEFCLSLHNPNAKRRETIEQLIATIQKSKKKYTLGKNVNESLEKLEFLKKKLNGYDEQLHSFINPIGMSIYSLFGKIEKYSKFDFIDYHFDNVLDISKDDLQHIIQLLNSLSNLIRENGYLYDCIWYGSDVSKFTFEFKKEYEIESKKYVNLLDLCISFCNDINNLIGIDTTNYNVKDVLCLSDKIDFLLTTPQVNYNWINLDIDSTINEVNNCRNYEILYNNNIDKEEKLSYYFNAVKNAISNLKIYQNDYDYKNYSNNIAFLNLNPIEISDIIHDLTIEIKNYRLALDDLKFDIEDKNSTKIENESNDKELEIVKKEYSSLKKKLENAVVDFNTLRSQISEKYDDNVLELDIDSMLSRYRTEYNKITRIFNSKFNKDQKDLQSYSKTGIKYKYHDQILNLNNLRDTKNAKNKKLSIQKDFDTINDKLNTIEKKKAEINKKYQDISEKIDILISRVKQYENNILSAINAIENSHNHETESLHQKYFLCLDNIKQLLDYDLSNKSYDLLINKLEWINQFKSIHNNYNMNIDFEVSICDKDNDALKNLDNLRKSLTFIDNKHKTINIDKIRLFSYNVEKDIVILSLDKSKEFLEKSIDMIYLMDFYVDYNNIESELEKLGVHDLANVIEASKLRYDSIVGSFLKCYYSACYDKIIEDYPDIKSFRRRNHDSIVDNFRKLDVETFSISSSSIISKLSNNLPDFDSFMTAGIEVSLLKREISKKRKLMPLRKLIASIPTLLPKMKPCIMMSPLSVSTYFASSDYHFDTVIFDEASQIKTEDAICSIMRGNQVIIAGDSKQMPPTDFFNTSFDDENIYDEDDDTINELGAYESLLEEFSTLPSKTLLWHYRSKNESLISFSNLNFYDNSLITFPSALDDNENTGVEYVYVRDGRYSKNLGGNIKEAEKVADLVFEHFKNEPSRSIGIIAFGELQQNAIEDAITKRREVMPEFERFFGDDLLEPLFVKNLETVQGNERDTIIFSIGYAPDENNNFRMNFGPLSLSGGERRLNVAITRARYNLKLVGSIKSTDIAVDRIHHQGPKLLQKYIEFAINNRINIENNLINSRSIDTFNKCIYKFLLANNYDVDANVGCSEYKIDFAIKAENTPNKYVIGIECDGFMYHSAINTRERDRLRTSVLKNMGWTMYRVWSTEWIRNPEMEQQRLLNAIQDAILNNSSTNVVSSKKVSCADYKNYLKVGKKDTFKNDYKNLSLYAFEKNARNIPTRDFEDTIMKILVEGYSYDKQTLFKNVAKFGYNKDRLGSVISSKLETAYKNLLSKNMIKEKNGIISKI